MDLNSQLVQSQCSFHYMSNSSPREILILQESAPGGVIFCVFVFLCLQGLCSSSQGHASRVLTWKS